MNIAEDKFIDRYNLELENVKQASLFYDYSIALADSEKELDIAKSKYAIIKAEVALEVRKDGKLPDGTKVTKDAVDDYVTTHSDVIKADKRLTEAYHEVKIMKAAVGAMEQKKSMITNLVKLQLSGYYNTEGHGRGAKTNTVDDAMLDYLNKE